MRVVYHYGGTPEFVVLGGLVPPLLCRGAPVAHAGTTDIDVQVDLEIACGSVNAPRLERALSAGGFTCDGPQIWRWRAEADGAVLVKFELLADLPDQPAAAVAGFAGCERLGAVNLRGTGFAARDNLITTLAGKVAGVERQVGVRTTGLAGFLMAKLAAARSRRADKDWYDIAYVLQHNDHGGPAAAAGVVREKFAVDLPPMAGDLADLRANFAEPAAQGPQAYANMMRRDAGADEAALRADAIVAVEVFCDALEEDV